MYLRYIQENKRRKEQHEQGFRKEAEQSRFFKSAYK